MKIKLSNLKELIREALHSVRADSASVILTPLEFQRRLDMNLCPICARYNLISPLRIKLATKEAENGERVVSGKFYECSRHGWRHYYLSQGSADAKPRETAGGLPAVKKQPTHDEIVSATRPFKRQKLG